MTPPRRSLRIRLTLWYAATLAVLLLVFAVEIFLMVRASLRDELLAGAQRDLTMVGAAVAHSPARLDAVESQQGVAHFRAGPEHRSRGWIAAGLDEAPTPAANQPAWWTNPAGDRFMLLAAAPLGTTIVVARDANDYRLTMHSLLLTLGIGFPSTLAFAVLGGYVLAGRALRPVGAMAAQARAITARNLAGRLTVHSPPDELSELALIFNETLARLEASFAELARFSSDASHQMRTPLTVMRTMGETALTRGADDPAALRETIGAMLDEAGKLHRLVETLLVIARADAGHLPPRRAPVDLGSLAAGHVELLAILAEEKNITLRLSAEPDVVVSGDETLLGHAFLNVLDNAVKYTPPGGTIRVRVGRGANGRAVVEVEDSGPGVAPAEREAIFGRFYRGGGSAVAPGTGLGLAVARRVAETHGGTLTAHPGAEGGALFRLELP